MQEIMDHDTVRITQLSFDWYSLLHRSGILSLHLELEATIVIDRTHQTTLDLLAKSIPAWECWLQKPTEKVLFVISQCPEL